MMHCELVDIAVSDARHWHAAKYKSASPNAGPKPNPNTKPKANIFLIESQGRKGDPAHCLHFYCEYVSIQLTFIRYI